MPTPEESIEHPVDYLENLEPGVYVQSNMTGEMQCAFARNYKCQMAIADTRGEECKTYDVVQIHTNANTDAAKIAEAAANRATDRISFASKTEDKNGGFVGEVKEFPTMFVATCRLCRYRARQIVIEQAAIEQTE